jgi:hypothetical protein
MNKIDAKHFPHLAEFARGYLHQDVVPEHGSPVAAAKAYVLDLEPKDRAALLREIRHLRKQHFEFREVASTLGAAWHFSDPAQSEEVLSALEHGLEPYS